MSPGHRRVPPQHSVRRDNNHPMLNPRSAKQPMGGEALHHHDTGHGIMGDLRQAIDYCRKPFERGSHGYSTLTRNRL